MLGKFISADSFVQNFSDPQTLNRYSYCRNNPLAYTDPSGNVFGIDDLIIGAIIGALFGAIQSHGDPMAMLFGAGVGALSAGIFSYASEATAAAIAGSVTDKVVMGAISYGAGGAAAGTFAGGMNAAYYGGDIGRGALRGGLIGGAIGAASGAINGYFKGVSPITTKGISVEMPTSQLTVDKSSIDQCFMDSDPLLSNPQVARGFDTAWQESLPGSTQCVEQGGCITLKDGTYSIERWTAGTDRSITGSCPADITVADFHTHSCSGNVPYMPGYVYKDLVPSGYPGDLASSASLSYPSYIYNRIGIIRIEPGGGDLWYYVYYRAFCKMFQM